MKGHVRVASDSSAGFRIWTDSEPLQAEAAGSDTVWRCRLAISVDSRHLANPAGRWQVRQGWMKQNGLHCGPGSSDAADLPKRAVHALLLGTVEEKMPGRWMAVAMAVGALRKRGAAQHWRAGCRPSPRVRTMCACTSSQITMLTWRIGLAIYDFGTAHCTLHDCALRSAECAWARP